jgi:hypothetical protein
MAKADTNARDKNGWTALHYAACLTPLSADGDRPAAPTSQESHPPAEDSGVSGAPDAEERTQVEGGGGTTFVWPALPFMRPALPCAWPALPFPAGVFRGDGGGS